MPKFTMSTQNASWQKDFPIYFCPTLHLKYFCSQLDYTSENEIRKGTVQILRRRATLPSPRKGTLLPGAIPGETPPRA